MDNPIDPEQLLKQANAQFVIANRATYEKTVISTKEAEDAETWYQAELSCFKVIQAINGAEKIQIEVAAPSIKLYKQVVERKATLKLGFCREHEECTKLYPKMLTFFAENDCNINTVQYLLDIIALLITKKEKEVQLGLMKSLGEKCTSKAEELFQAKELLDGQPEQLKKIKDLLVVCNCIKSQKVAISEKQLHYLTPERVELWQQLHALQGLQEQEKKKKKKAEKEKRQKEIKASKPDRLLRLAQVKRLSLDNNQTTRSSQEDLNDLYKINEQLQGSGDVDTQHKMEQIIQDASDKKQE